MENELVKHQHGISIKELRKHTYLLSKTGQSPILN